MDYSKLVENYISSLKAEVKLSVSDLIADLRLKNVSDEKLCEVLSINKQTENKSSIENISTHNSSGISFIALNDTARPPDNIITPSKPPVKSSPSPPKSSITFTASNKSKPSSNVKPASKVANPVSKEPTLVFTKFPTTKPNQKNDPKMDFTTPNDKIHNSSSIPSVTSKLPNKPNERKKSPYKPSLLVSPLSSSWNTLIESVSSESLGPPQITNPSLFNPQKEPAQKATPSKDQIQKPTLNQPKIKAPQVVERTPLADKKPAINPALGTKIPSETDKSIKPLQPKKTENASLTESPRENNLNITFDSQPLDSPYDTKSQHKISPHNIPIVIVKKNVDFTPVIRPETLLSDRPGSRNKQDESGNFLSKLKMNLHNQLHEKEMEKQRLDKLQQESRLKAENEEKSNQVKKLKDEFDEQERKTIEAESLRIEIVKKNLQDELNRKVKAKEAERLKFLEAKEAAKKAQAEKFEKQRIQQEKENNRKLIQDQENERLRVEQERKEEEIRIKEADDLKKKVLQEQIKNAQEESERTQKLIKEQENQSLRLAEEKKKVQSDKEQKIKQNQSNLNKKVKESENFITLIDSEDECDMDIESNDDLKIVPESPKVSYLDDAEPMTTYEKDIQEKKLKLDAYLKQKKELNDSEELAHKESDQLHLKLKNLSKQLEQIQTESVDLDKKIHDIQSSMNDIHSKIKQASLENKRNSNKSPVSVASHSTLNPLSKNEEITFSPTQFTEDNNNNLSPQTVKRERELAIQQAYEKMKQDAISHQKRASLSVQQKNETISFDSLSVQQKNETISFDSTLKRPSDHFEWPFKKYKTEPEPNPESHNKSFISINPTPTIETPLSPKVSKFKNNHDEPGFAHEAEGPIIIIPEKKKIQSIEIISESESMLISNDSDDSSDEAQESESSQDSDIEDVQIQIKEKSKSPIITPIDEPTQDDEPSESETNSREDTTPPAEITNTDETQKPETSSESICCDEPETEIEKLRKLLHQTKGTRTKSADKSILRTKSPQELEEGEIQDSKESSPKFKSNLFPVSNEGNFQSESTPAYSNRYEPYPKETKNIRIKKSREEKRKRKDGRANENTSAINQTSSPIVETQNRGTYGLNDMNSMLIPNNPTLLNTTMLSSLGINVDHQTLQRAQMLANLVQAQQQQQQVQFTQAIMMAMNGQSNPNLTNMNTMNGPPPLNPLLGAPIYNNMPMLNPTFMSMFGMMNQNINPRS